MLLQYTSLLTILLFLQASGMHLATPEKNLFTTLPKELMPIIGSYFNCITMKNWKLTCKKFNKHVNYEHISSAIIKLENYTLCTNGLIYFAEIKEKNSFAKLIQNNFSQRIAEIKILGYENNLLLKNQIYAYKGIQPQKFDYSVDYHSLLKVIHINPNIEDESGVTPLMIACQLNNVDMITILLNNKKTNLDKSDQQGYTALYIACYKNNYDLANLLVQKGANTNILIKQGFTLLDWAYQEEIDPKIIKLLHDNKAQNGWKFIITIYKPIITATIFMIIYMSHISNNKTIRIALLSLAISLAILQKYSL